MVRARRHEICAVCHQITDRKGNRNIYHFKIMLAHYGIPGDKAHPDCIFELGKKRNKDNIVRKMFPLTDDEEY